MKKGLKRFGLTVLVVIALVSVVDVAAGKVLDWMLPQISNQGEIGKHYFVMNEAKAPIVIVGSSRAAHHYIPSIIQDSLGVDVYNMGLNGTFLTYNCCVIKTLLDRYKPQLIVWEFDPQYLLNGRLDPVDKMYPYVKTNEYAANAIRTEIGAAELAKLTSNLYRYNSDIIRIALRFAKRHSYECDELLGYEPLKARDWNFLPIFTAQEDTVHLEISIHCINVFKQTIQDIINAGVAIVLVNSPKYATKANERVLGQRVSELCDSMGIVYIDNLQSPQFAGHPNYFYDNGHFNELGAEVNTNMFIQQMATMALALSRESCRTE